MEVKTVVQQESLLKYNCELGEGSLWDAIRQRLYFVDIIGCRIFTYEPSTGIHGFQSFDRNVTALALLEDDSGLLAALQDGLAFIKFDQLPFPPTNSPSTYKRLSLNLKHLEGFNRFNECCVDPTGKRWIVGTMMNEEDFPKSAGGGLYSVTQTKDGGLSADLLLDNLTVSNGMGWTKDNKTLYFTDSLRKEIGKYDYDIDTGKVCNKVIFSNVDDEFLGVPDGMCQDDEYHIWSARWGSSKVIRFTPEGKIDLIVHLPKGLNITSCIWGGPNLDELYVTSAKTGTTDEQIENHPSNGDLFVVKGLGFKGKERTRFKGKF
ncbi:uncharacterized protein I206_101020 [Kwoniella pini CBS 10737]|uniref:SMP-30/Gluconolactonase/LRE-like region domain-containing protein n=1 Tax=Kwoniella pini CBS 10737 TaxID=1296096 RepID=A0A1B9IBI0_9TREE|nr:uncharacterized protein I206_00306 [Kwoniella pini CBS 10737]OCF53005.1 hypothetical protein I206_00306 [Kwoniella pini CBS 10737]